MASRQPKKKQPSSKNYVLVVDFNGDPDIFQLSYDTSWCDVAAMLQVKYECNEPTFFYSDDEDDEIGLNTEEEFAIALKMAKRNDDVLHLKVKTQSQPQSNPSSRFSSTSGVSYTETSKSPIGTGLAWASNAVKQAVHGIGQSLISVTNDNHSSISMDEVDAFKQSETSDPTVTTPERNHNNTQQPWDLQSQQQGTSQQMQSVPQDLPTNSSAHVTRQPVNVTDEIEVPTSLEDEVSVKMPYTGESSSCEEGTSAEKIEPVASVDVRQTIQQEVRLVINKEMSALREEIQTNLLPQLRNTLEPTGVESSDDSMSKPVRSPKSIKREIRQLKKEMSEAKLQKRQKKHKHHDKMSSDDATGPQSSKEMRQARKFAASFICENLLDGSSVGTGQTFTKYWVLKNEGARAWDHKIKLELLKETPSSDGSPVDASIESDALSHPSNKQWGPELQQVTLPTVNSRETTVIAVRHIAPHHECSYTSSWRLHRKGQPFGPRIWCNVSVVNHEQMPVMDSEPCSTLLTTDDEKSYIKENSDWIRPRHPSSQSDHNQQSSMHDDDISNMLSFEMTDVGKNFPQQVPPTMSTSYNEPRSSHLTSIPQETEEPQASQQDDKPVIETEVAPTETKDEVLLEKEPAVDVEKPPPQEEEPHAEMEEEVAEKQDDAAENKDQDEEFEEFESIKDLSHQEEQEVQNAGTSEDRDEAEDRLRDEQFGSTSSSDMEGSETPSSECMSDFEVIPLPECFDTSRPLSGSEKGDKSNPASLSLTDDKTEKQDSQTVEMMPLNDAEQLVQPEIQIMEVPAPTEAQQNGIKAVDVMVVDEDEQSSSNEKTPVADAPATSSKALEPSNDGTNVVEEGNVTEEMIVNENEQNSANENTPAVTTAPTSLPEASNDDKSVNEMVVDDETSNTIAKIPESQSTSVSAPGPSTNISEAVTKPKPVPQSVLDIDNPCEVQDYSQGYEIPQQAHIDAEQPWIKHPITLPQSVLNADEPWVPTTTASVYPTLPPVTPPPTAPEMTQAPLAPSGSSPPVPQRRSVTQSLPVDHTLPTSDMAASPLPHVPAESEEVENAPDLAEEDDNPQILYPPNLDADQNEDEFTLAPQAPVTPNAPQESLPYYNPSPMEVLIEMGFIDLHLNENVLSECDGDINRAVQALLFGAEGDSRRPQPRAYPHQQQQQQQNRRRRDGSFYA